MKTHPSNNLVLYLSNKEEIDLETEFDIQNQCPKTSIFNPILTCQYQEISLIQYDEERDSETYLPIQRLLLKKSLRIKNIYIQGVLSNDDIYKQDELLKRNQHIIISFDVAILYLKQTLINRINFLDTDGKIFIDFVIFASFMNVVTRKPLLRLQPGDEL